MNVEPTNLNKSDLSSAAARTPARRFRRWRLPASTVAISVLCALLLSHILPTFHQISMVVGPVSQGNSKAGALQQLAGSSGLSGLSGLAGINLPSSTGQEFQIYLQLLKTPDLAASLETKYGLMHRVFDDQWSPKYLDWKAPSGPKAWAKALLAVLFNRPGWQPPTAVSFSEYLQDRLQVVQIRTTGLYTIALKDNDPQRGVLLLHALAHEADEFLRSKTLVRQQAYVDYLLKRVNETTNTSQREALLNILLDEERTLMVAQSGLPFAGELVVEPYVATQPVGLSAVLDLFLAVAVGLLVGYGIIWLGWEAKLAQLFHRSRRVFARTRRVRQ